MKYTVYKLETALFACSRGDLFSCGVYIVVLHYLYV